MKNLFDSYASTYICISQVLFKFVASKPIENLKRTCNIFRCQMNWVYIISTLLYIAGQKILKIQAKKLVKSKKSNFFFREIAFLAVLNFFPSSKIDFWPFLKLQKMEFVQNIFSCYWLVFNFTSFFGLYFFKFSGFLIY